MSLSFRRRAELRQRSYRQTVLHAGFRTHEHWLDEEAEERGKNFFMGAFAAANERAKKKGVARRTFFNMLSSQAMCFNLFSPLQDNLELATSVLAPLLDRVQTIDGICIEYTPEKDLLGDQHGQAGVDCDVLLFATWMDGARGLVSMETKFVEPDFSACGFRRAGKRGTAAYCPDDVQLGDDQTGCRYVSNRNYRYWEQTRALRTIQLPHASPGCPFAGPLWQLWTNHTLVHADAKHRQLARARFAVCAPEANEALLQHGAVLDHFRGMLYDPASFAFVPTDALIDRIVACARGLSPEHVRWCEGLGLRYGRI